MLSQKRSGQGFFPLYSQTLSACACGEVRGGIVRIRPLLAATGNTRSPASAIRYQTFRQKGVLDHYVVRLHFTDGTTQALEGLVIYGDGFVLQPKDSDPNCCLLIHTKSLILPLYSRQGSFYDSRYLGPQLLRTDCQKSSERDSLATRPILTGFIKSSGRSECVKMSILRMRLSEMVTEQQTRMEGKKSKLLACLQESQRLQQAGPLGTVPSLRLLCEYHEQYSFLRSLT